MKILYVANSRIPTEKAHGLQIVKMCEAFALAGHDVTLLLPRRRNLLADKDIFEFYNAEQNFTVQKIWTPDPRLLLGLRSGWYIRIQSLLFAIRLFFFSLILRDKSTYTVYTRDILLLPVLTKLFSNVVWEGHVLPSHVQTYRRFWQRCYRIVTITKQLKKDLISLGVGEEKIFVAADGVDFKQFDIDIDRASARKKLGLVATGQLVIYTGHLYSWKGADILARAAEQLPTGVMVVFVGGTDSDVGHFKTQYQQKKNINIVGRVSHQQIPYYLKAADVLVLPNSAHAKISRAYTSPLKLFEYLASGRPVVAADLPSIREVIDEQSCIFFEPDNPTDLAAKIATLLNGAAGVEKIAAEGRAIAHQYTWGKRAQKISDFLAFEQGIVDN